MKYSRILELISLWQEFEVLEESHDLAKKDAKEHDFSRFAVWLSRRVSDDKRVSIELKKAPLPLKEVTKENVKKGKKEQEKMPVQATYQAVLERGAEFEKRVRRGEEDVMEYHQYLPLEAQISALLTRMNRFSMFYTKKAFQGLVISNATEFGILAGIKSLGNPRKTDVINFNLLEKTTGTELLKRMIADGVVVESDDADDKRSKRVRLTRKGEKLVEEASMRLLEMSSLVTGNLTHEQKQELSQMLHELGDFHNTIYFNQAELSVSEIIERNVVKI
ncbi:MAG: MarR family transcriptional regulator [Candidatus Kapaibacterium sp.]|nr:MAG: MarR family transcriptional regulator [Candidatus Kapabacteria bacterium]